MSRFAARQRMKQSLARKSFYKTVTLNVDNAGKSDRKEWGHLKYQHYYDPSEAFEIAIQWSVASGMSPFGFLTASYKAVHRIAKN